MAGDANNYFNSCNGTTHLYLEDSWRGSGAVTLFLHCHCFGRCTRYADEKELQRGKHVSSNYSAKSDAHRKGLASGC